jgi:hypothetical protein
MGVSSATPLNPLDPLYPASWHYDLEAPSVGGSLIAAMFSYLVGLFCIVG